VYTRVSLRKCAYTSRCMPNICTMEQNFPGLYSVVFLSVGHYLCYRSPDFNNNKIILALVFPLVFFQGYLPKIIGVYVCMI
jgi:hypothetical protein